MARPNEPDVWPKCTQISLNFRCPITVDMFVIVLTIFFVFEFKTSPFWVQPTCNISFQSFQGELAIIIVKLYGFLDHFQRAVYELKASTKLMSEVSRASAAASNFGAKM